MLELRRAFRSLGCGRNRTATLVVVFVLGVCAATFGLVAGLADALWVAPLPFPRPAELKECELVQVGAQGLFGWAPSLSLEQAWERAAPRGVKVGALTSTQGTIEAGSANGTIPIVRVTQGTLRLLGTRPSAGDLLGPPRLARSPVISVVLSLPLARDGFGNAGRAIGREVKLMGLPARVVGVMPAGFHSLR